MVSLHGYGDEHIGHVLDIWSKVNALNYKLIYHFFIYILFSSFKCKDFIHQIIRIEITFETDFECLVH